MATITELRDNFIAAWDSQTLTDTQFRNLVLNEIVQVYNALIVVDNNQASLFNNQEALNTTINQIASQTNTQLNMATQLIDKQILNLSRSISGVATRVQKRLGDKL